MGGIYIGMDGLALKIKSIYVGLENMAFKVLRGYMGMDGLAVPVYSSGLGLAERGSPLPLGAAAPAPAAASLSTVAFIGDSTSMSAYTASLTRSLLPALTGGPRTQGMAAARAGQYALFAGGGDGTAAVGKVDAYNLALVRSTPGMDITARGELGGASAGTSALFAGGHTVRTLGAPRLTVVESYNEALVRSTLTPLPSAREGMGAGTFLDCALFGGGTSDGDSSTTAELVMYTPQLVAQMAGSLSFERCRIAVGCTQTHAFFAGGDHTSRVDAYNAAFVRLTVPPLSAAIEYASGCAISGFVLIGGGAGMNVEYASPWLDVYSPELIRTTTTINRGCIRPAAVAVGQYALFAGGTHPLYGILDSVMSYTIE